MTENRFSRWFLWLRRGAYHAVLADYRAIRKPALADIAVRARLWNFERPEDPALGMAFDNGRRSMAAEILELAKADPEAIEAFIKSKIA